MNAPAREIITGLDYGYIDRTVANIRSSLNITQAMQPIEPGPLLSIHLQSNRPDNFATFLEELEASLDDPSRIEVVVKIDDTDTAMNELLPKLVAKHAFTVKYLSTPLVGGFFELWRSMNDMLKICHPHAYFLWNMNDEMAVLNKGWDTALAKYVGLFPDHIFRLRTSLFRFRNYYDFWECGFAPETSAITTKRWIDICGDWNPCLGPDSFNQCVSFYFGYHDRFNKHKVLRDVPIHDILLAGEGAFIGLEGDKLWRRMRGATRAWFRLMSHKTQTDASRRSQKLIAHIWAYENKIKDFKLEDDKARERIVLRDGHGRRQREYRYGLSHFRTTLANAWRTTHYFYYGGGGEHGHGRRFSSFCAFLALRYNMFEWMHNVYKWQVSKRTQLRKSLSSLLRRGQTQEEKKLRLNRPHKIKIVVRQMLRMMVIKGFNRGIRFHQSVYSFDAVNSTLDWQTIERLLEKAAWPIDYQDRARQQTLFKCLLLQHWYHLSDNELEAALGRDLAFQRFIGVALDMMVPSLSDITKTRSLLENAGVKDTLFRKASLLTEKEDLPAKPIISNVA